MNPFVDYFQSETRRQFFASCLREKRNGDDHHEIRAQREQRHGASQPDAGAQVPHQRREGSANSAAQVIRETLS